MNVKDVVFVRQQGGLARTAPGEDHISAFISYGDVPADSEGTARTKIETVIFSLKQAEDLGIETNDAADTTDATYIHNIWHYHISEFFRTNPTGALWLGLYETPDAVAYKELGDIQRLSEGRIRQAAIYDTKAFAEGTLGDIQSIANTLEIDHMPLSALYTANTNGVITDFSGASAPTINDTPDQKNVSMIIGQDAGNTGKQLFDKYGLSISCIGATLGAVSSASVHESIAWVQEFNMASSELDVIGLSNGQLISELPRTQQDAIDTKGYIFLKKHIGIAGSYFNDTHTAALPTNDFAFIENNRTLDKAIRGIRTALLPQLSSPLYVEANGNLSFDTIGYFESLAGRPLEAMRIDGELSNYNVFIDPTQQVLSNSELKIQVSVIPVGVARTIEVSIGFTLSIA